MKFTGSLIITAIVRLDSVNPFDYYRQILFRGDDRGALDPSYLGVKSNGTLVFHGETAASAFAVVSAPFPLGRFVGVVATDLTNVNSGPIES